MTRHHLDGNAIAADAHYGQDQPEDYYECATCGEPFGDPIEDDDCVLQHRHMIDRCETCAAHYDDIGWIE